MSVAINDHFQKRLRRIVRRHNQMAVGVHHVVTKDNLIVAQPRLIRPRFPLKGVMMLFVVSSLFKSFLFASIGPADYDTRVAALADGTIVEQAGSWVMFADPATQFIGDFIRESFL